MTRAFYLLGPFLFVVGFLGYGCAFLWGIG